MTTHSRHNLVHSTHSLACPSNTISLFEYNKDGDVYAVWQTKDGNTRTVRTTGKNSISTDGHSNRYHIIQDGKPLSEEEIFRFYNDLEFRTTVVNTISEKQEEEEASSSHNGQNSNNTLTQDQRLKLEAEEDKSQADARARIDARDGYTDFVIKPSYFSD